MKTMMPVTNTSIEALDFIASRLLIFKRVRYDLMLELTTQKFSLPNSNHLFAELIQKKVVCLNNGSLTILNDLALKQFCIDADWQNSRTKRPQAA